MELLKGGELLKNVKSLISNELKDVPPLNRPGFGLIINNDDYGSIQYANQLIKDCNEIGINIFCARVSDSSDDMFIYRMVEEFNNMSEINAIMLQHPLPSKFRDMEKDIINMIDPRKIIDCPYWKMNLEEPDNWPGTAYGIYLMLLSYFKDDNLNGKKVVVIGRSQTVGMPLTMILMHSGATVTTCHTKTGIDNIRKYCEYADIIISAAGCANLIDNTFNLNKNQIIIDVGCNNINGKLCGDIAFEQVADKVAAITPVPGGVGPMTRVAILTEIIGKRDIV